MKILAGDNWQEGFLDYYRDTGEYRIRVLLFLNLEKLEDMFFTFPNSPRMVWNYVREIGVMEVFRKIISRRREKNRNDKHISCGLGRIVETANERVFATGQMVAFLAPAHPPCLERIVLPRELIIEAGEFDVSVIPANTILYKTRPVNDNAASRWWSSLRGWSAHAGLNIERETGRKIMHKVLQTISSTDWHDARRLPVNECKIKEVKRAPARHFARSRKQAVLFGLGNYAKTIIIPNIKRHLYIEVIHETDPTQIPQTSDFRNGWDTSPMPRHHEHYDVFLIAGYHHSHAPLAVDALNKGACAVVEKPIAVDDRQLTELLNAMENSPGQLFACFHKRYLPFNEIALRDLGICRGEPVSYHCIVYEVPLPELHWYRWPNSKSRLVSNGCHWLDHFLFLNNFCEVLSYDLFVARDGTINCSVTLKNGAFFTMVLTDNGSRRIGVQDYIELRANGVTVKMINSSIYLAEDRYRITRKIKINKMFAYRNMYQTIGQRIVRGLRGDTTESLRVSAGLVLALERKFREIKAGDDS